MSLVELPVKPLTLDDVAALADADPDHRYELQEGNLLVMPPPDAEHAEFQAELVVWLRSQGYGRGQVLTTPGLEMARQDNPLATGRSPDIVVCRQPVRERTVWLDPADVLLVIEIVSPGSESLERVTKPVEYARAGIPNYWRVERGMRATVHVLQLGTGADGHPVYVPHRTALLDDMLDSGDAASLIAAG
jgi:Uma2 family endonuclease